MSHEKGEGSLSVVGGREVGEVDGFGVDVEDTVGALLSGSHEPNVA